ncbi:MAG: hypothetical protein J6X91_00745 [Bacteroidales bacterium]|nr:hypothetical protein [Bacteroidales bacterium]MBP5517182.1 hypothetical protein [Bacteroidales bacterium]
MLQHTVIYNPYDSLAPALKPEFPDQGNAACNTFYLDRDSSAVASDSSVNIAKAWNGTKLSTGATVEIPKVKMMSERYVDLGIVLVLVIFFLVATERIIEGLGRAFWASLLVKRQIEVDDDLSWSSSRDIAFFFFFPTVVFALSPAPEYFVLALGLIALGLALKYGILSVLDYVNRTSVFKFAGRVGANYLIMASPFLLLYKISPYLSLLCIIPAVLYLVMVSRIILKNNFSVYFYILYICTLELLPAAVLIRLFV